MQPGGSKSRHSEKKTRAQLFVKPHLWACNVRSIKKILLEGSKGQQSLRMSASTEAGFGKQERRARYRRRVLQRLPSENLLRADAALGERVGTPTDCPSVLQARAAAPWAPLSSWYFQKTPRVFLMLSLEAQPGMAVLLRRRPTAGFCMSCRQALLRRSTGMMLAL